MGKLRIAVVGCGRIAAKHLKVIGASPDLELVGVCDGDAARARKVGAEARVPAFENAVQMARELRPDLVTILVPSGAHARVTCDVVPHVGNVIVEKPMALTLDDADAMISACEHAGVGLHVVKQNRYNRPVARLRQALDQGRFGKLVLGTVRVRWCRDQAYYDEHAWRGTWEHDGGVFANQASHHIDLLQWMMGPVESVQAYTTTRLVNIETEDVGVAIFRFTSGALGIVEATTATRPKDLEGSISILGEKGSVVVGGFAADQIETWNFSDPVPEDGNVKESAVNPTGDRTFGHSEFYADVVDCIRRRRRPMLDGLEGRKSLELITAIYEAAARRSEVRIRYVPERVRLGRASSAQHGGING